ncbi:MAG: hypothetical protein ABIG67_07535 [Pseudomonadota bacterium]
MVIDQKHGWGEVISVFRSFLRDSLKISLTLFKIMVPISIGVKIIKELGGIEYLAVMLKPLMTIVGLPGSMGLVWATAMMTNLYGGAIVFISLIRESPLTVAQVTVLTSMMLVAHNLPIELKIAQEAGVRIWAMGLLRLGGAFLFGFILNLIFTWGEWLQGTRTLSWTFPQKKASLGVWALGELRNLVMIFLIIMSLLAVMKILEKIGIMTLLTRMLHPVLVLLGIGKGATPITIIGMTLGIAYGGGLIIQGARSGAVYKRDIFFSMALMGLSHALIEDTLLMMLLGGHISGVLLGRVLFSLLVIYLLVKAVSRLPEALFDRFISRPGLT